MKRRDLYMTIGVSTIVAALMGGFVFWVLRDRVGRANRFIRYQELGTKKREGIVMTDAEKNEFAGLLKEFSVG